MGWILAGKIMMPPHSFSWILFDCFNTLIDDFIQGGDESGISPIIHIPAEAGLYESPTAFIEAYTQRRNRQYHEDACPEILLEDRLRVLLAGRASHSVIEEVVNRMMAVYAEEYHKTVRVTPGTESMLNHWRGRVSMGVVSNYFTADIHTPGKLLSQYGLLDHFEFVLNSAEFGYKKPDKTIYREALRLAELSGDQADRVLFIGDTPQADILMPKELGFQVLYLDRSADRPHRPVPDDIPTITHWDQFRS